MSQSQMHTFDDALGIVMAQARLLGSERVDLGDAQGRILAEDVVSDIDMPPFDKSAMDGYACRREDLAGDLSVLETIAAGTVPQHRVGVGECSKIMTGAIVPEGADCVVQVELTEETGPGAVRITGESTRDNICRRAEDIRHGDMILPRGAKILPAHIGMLATVGCARPLVARQPAVGVLATGDELVEPAVTPGPSQIRNSNGPQLCAQVEQAGGRATYFGIIPDTEEALDAAVKQAAATCDVILMSGGVSMGDFDLVPDVLARNGVRFLVEKVAIKPGMPTMFGFSDEVFCFGLPGNPVSTFVIFELLTRPFLLGLMGHDYRPTVLPMRLTEDVSRRKADREAWVPVEIVAPGRVRAVEYHGSGHLNAMTRAFGLIRLPRGIKGVEADATIDVRQI